MWKLVFCSHCDCQCVNKHEALQARASCQWSLHCLPHFIRDLTVFFSLSFLLSVQRQSSEKRPSEELLSLVDDVLFFCFRSRRGSTIRDGNPNSSQQSPPKLTGNCRKVYTLGGSLFLFSLLTHCTCLLVACVSCQGYLAKTDQ